MRANTGWERYAYGHEAGDKIDRYVRNPLQGDDGIRIPFNSSPEGMLTRMRELRDLRRALGGARPHFTTDEALEVTRLAGTAHKLGWTYAEIARALGVSNQSARGYVARSDSTLELAGTGRS